jgi:hypothetical protein
LWADCALSTRRTWVALGTLQRQLLDDRQKRRSHIAEPAAGLLNHFDEFVARERSRRIKLSDALVPHGHSLKD